MGVGEVKLDTPKFRDFSVLAKMRERRIENLSDEELSRAFASTVAPTICMRIARRMITAGLTIEEVRHE